MFVVQDTGTQRPHDRHIFYSVFWKNKRKSHFLSLSHVISRFFCIHIFHFSSRVPQQLLRTCTQAQPECTLIPHIAHVPPTLPLPQVSLQSVNSLSNHGIFLSLRLFPALSPWTLGQAALLVVSVGRNVSLLGPPFGSAYVLNTSLATMVPPNYPPPSSHAPAPAPSAGT